MDKDGSSPVRQSYAGTLCSPPPLRKKVKDGPVLDAAKKNMWSKVKPDIVEDNQLASCYDQDSRTLLHFAASHGNKEMAEYLLSINPNLKFAEDRWGEMPLMDALSGKGALNEALIRLLGDGSVQKPDPELDIVNELAAVSEVPSVATLLKDYSELLKPLTLQGYVTLKLYGKMRIEKKWNKKDKMILRVLLLRLLDLHNKDRCHGDLNASCVMILDVFNRPINVKLVGAKYSVLSPEILTKEYEILSGIVKNSFGAELPESVLHFCEHLCKDEQSRLAVYIYNAPCTWESAYIPSIIQYISNKMYHAMTNDKYMMHEEAKKADVDWKSKINQSSCVHLKKQLADYSTGRLIDFMRSTFAHLGKDINDPDPLAVADEFMSLFAGFLCILVEQLVRRRFFVQGDPIDRASAGSLIKNKG